MFRKSSKNLQALLLFCMVSLAATSCLKDPDTTPNNNNNNNNKDGRARIEITDAPIDDANVKGVFVTVVDVKVDGKSWAGFDGKTTFDLLAYQKGQTKLLGEGELAIGTYNEVILVLDTETDANGDSPGCYVKDAQGIKRKLEGSSQFTIKAKGSFATKADKTTEAVIDMDLRKSIVYKTGSDSTFQFVTDPELQAAVRLMDKASAGSISGDCTDGVSNSDKVIVYAYKKGSYSATEKFAQGASLVQFKNAVTSSVLADDGTYNLAFLEAGTYEVHFISYKKDADGRLQAKGELVLNLLSTTLNALSLDVKADVNISLDASVSGILFF